MPFPDILKLNGFSSPSLVPKLTVPFMVPTAWGANRMAKVVLPPDATELPGWAMTEKPVPVTLTG